MHVAVGCPTFRRPAGLRRLLEGLNELRFERSPEPQLSVLIVNNDPACSVDHVIEELKPTFRWSLLCVDEPARGLSNARNRLLDLVPADADAIVFIDDDEVPSDFWLDALLSVRLTSQATVVQGPVEPHFTSPAPAWIKNGRFFELGPYQDGEPLHFAATNNSLMDVRVLRKLGLRFDPRFNDTGGEDQFFFGQVIGAGYKVVTAKDALVREWIPKERTTLRYLMKRKFRMGNTLAKIDRIESRHRWRIVRIAKGSARIALGLAQQIYLLPKGLAGNAEGLLNMAWGAGAIAGTMGVDHKEYRQAAPRAGGTTGPTIP